MLNTYIKNHGTTKTVVYNNNDNYVNETNWDADYDGEKANIYIKTNNDGNSENYNITLNKDDLADILNIESVNMPIDERLKMDFGDLNYQSFDKYYEPKYTDPQKIYIETICPKKPKYVAMIRKPKYVIKTRKPKYVIKTRKPKYVPMIENLANNHITSPVSGEELIVPITLNRKTMDNYSYTPRKRHLHPKSHITHKVYKIFKKPKTNRSFKHNRIHLNRKNTSHSFGRNSL
jgi:hypothetical protein